MVPQKLHIYKYIDYIESTVPSCVFTYLFVLMFYHVKPVSSCNTDLVGPVALNWGGATVQLWLAACLSAQCKPGNQAVRNSALRVMNIIQP